jgi:hypothetical protein
VTQADSVNCARHPILPSPAGISAGHVYYFWISIASEFRLRDGEGWLSCHGYGHGHCSWTYHREVTSIGSDVPEDPLVSSSASSARLYRAGDRRRHMGVIARFGLGGAKAASAAQA